MSLTLTGDVKIPLVGLGTWQALNEEELELALEAALEIGYRHIDTAAAYQNEQVIGRVLQKWFTSGKLKREDVFITTKLPPTNNHPDLVESGLKDSLQKLQLNYVDLYLLHFPVYLKASESGKPMEPMPTDIFGVWKKMEEQIDAKRVKAIGISNFNINQIDRISKSARIQPVSCQVELHVYFQQKDIREYCNKNNIVVVSYSSLGSPGTNEFFKRINRAPVVLPNILGDLTITNLAKKYGKTPGQIVLRYLTQIGIAIIPKSVKPARLKENFDILNFVLDSEDLEAVRCLDKDVNGRIFDLIITPSLKEHPEYPF